MSPDKKTINIVFAQSSTDALQANDSEYVRLVSLISDVWEMARCRAALAVNTELIEANW